MGVFNHYVIEVIFDDTHTLADVNVRGPGQYGSSYPVADYGRDLHNVLGDVADTITREERGDTPAEDTRDEVPYPAWMERGVPPSDV